MLKVLALTAVLFVSASAALADNVVATSGTITLQGSGLVTTIMQFSGANFSVGAHASGFGVTPCTCLSGQTITLSSNTGTWGASDLSGGVFLNGQGYTFTSDLFPVLPNVAGIGSLTFLGGPVTLPFSNDPTITLTAPFSMSGQLNGHAQNGGFSMTFSGSGTATLVLASGGLDRNGNRIYEFRSLTYGFQTPEPASIILLGSGLIFLVRRRFIGSLSR